MPQRTNFYSEEAQSILGRAPSWVVRWGVTVVFCILAGIIAGCYFIRYPQTVTAPISITTINPPSDLAASETGPARRAEYALRTAEKQVEKEVTQALLDARTAWARYLGAQEYVASAEEAARQVGRKYDLGAATVTDYNAAVTTRVKARSQLLQAKYEYLFKCRILEYYAAR